MPLKSFPLYSVHCLSLLDGGPKQTSEEPEGYSGDLRRTGSSHRSFSQMDECQHVRPSFGGACLGGGWGVEVNGGEAEGLERILST